MKKRILLSILFATFALICGQTVLSQTQNHFNPVDVEKLRAFLKQGNNLEILAKPDAELSIAIIESNPDDNNWAMYLNGVKWYYGVEPNDTTIAYLGTFGYEQDSTGEYTYTAANKGLAGKFDFSGLPQLFAIQQIDQNDLTSIDISDCPFMELFECIDNPVTTFNFNNCTKLWYVGIFGCSEFTYVDFSTCNLKQLHIRINDALTNIDLTGQINLTYASIWGNSGLKTLDVSGCTKLDSLYCYSNALTSLKYNDNLMLVNAANNELTSLDFSEHSRLEFLDCQMNQLTSLNLINCSALTWIQCSSNQLTELDLSTASSLNTLDAWENQFTTFDGSACPELTYVELEDNLLTSIDVTKNIKLGGLYLNNNQLTELDLTNNPGLQLFEAKNNHLSTLTIYSPYIWEVFCDDNDLIYLDVSVCEALDVLGASNNKLREIKFNETLPLALNIANNELTFSHIPPQSNYPVDEYGEDNFVYAPQKVIYGGEVTVSLDLSSEIEFAGIATTFDWYIADDTTSEFNPIPALEEVSGTFQIPNIYEEKILRCIMSNSVFPDFAEEELIKGIAYEVKIMPLHIEDNSQVSKFAISPNPASNQSLLEYTLLTDASISIKIYDINGTEIMQISDFCERGLHRLDLDLSEFVTGTYYCAMYSNGKIVANEKFVVKR